MVGIVLCLLGANEGGGCRTMVAVGYIQVGYSGKFLGYTLDCLLIIDHPESVAKTIGSYEIIFGFAGSNTVDYLLETAIVGEGKEYGFDIGVVDTHMFHAVFLFVTTGQLMLFDAAFHIVVHPCCHNKTILGTAVHSLRIDIVFLLVVLHEPSFVLEHVEVLNCFLVHFGVMLVKTGFKINLGFDDMIKRLGITLCLGTGLFRVKHIVGAGYHLFYHRFRGTYPLERFYFCHFLGMLI